MLKVQPRIESSRMMAWFSPVIAISLTLFISSLMLLWLHVSPVKAFEVFLLQPFSDSYNLGELMVKATPLLLCAIGLALCYRANIWNIGAEGQLLIGAVASSAVAVHVSEDAGTGMLLVTLLAGITAGMCWSAIPTFLNRVFHTNIILTTIMLNYIGLYTLLWAVHGPLSDPDGFGFPESVMFPDGVMLPLLSDSGRASVSVVAAIVIAIISAVLLFRTLPGFKIRVFGEDTSAAQYAGFNQNKIVWGVMLFAGALAGFAGAAEVTGPIGQLIPSVSPGYGYAAIIVAYLGRLNPVGIIVSSFFMGALYMGSDLAQIELGLPTAVTGLFQGTLLFSLLACDFLIYYQIKPRRKKPPTTVSPSALSSGASGISDKTSNHVSTHQKNENGVA
ncbi:ABC transporter permease [Vibrio mangrovi]|uniref:ABC transporter permease n=1 Tax=Vibrio mangrovi TaxID=474394 RepID=A0A1Y6IT39_9VIBR|nr:ABC transporter permease [Vibrio mangrovi]MDW6004500.1 ABC transporter permease [Vibrio mangrovi]SMS00788.1 Branched-chain amino acid transport system / permease component [Vibrio mangrovi]